MKKKTKTRIIVLISILIAAFLAGTILTGIQSKRYSLKVDGIDYIDMAFNSLDTAYDQLQESNQFQFLFHLCLGVTIGLVVLLIGFIVFSFLKGRMKERNQVTMYAAAPMGQQGAPLTQQQGQQFVAQMGQSQQGQQNIPPMGQSQQGQQNGQPMRQPSNQQPIITQVSQGMPNQVTGSTTNLKKPDNVAMDLPPMPQMPPIQPPIQPGH